MSEEFPWLKKALELDKKGGVATALDMIFDEIDELLLKGDFDSCNKILEILDPKELRPVISITFLTTTLPVASKLSSRPTFYAKVKEALKDLPGKDNILRGLEGKVSKFKPKF